MWYIYDMHISWEIKEVHWVESGCKAKIAFYQGKHLPGFFLKNPGILLQPFQLLDLVKMLNGDFFQTFARGFAVGFVFFEKLMKV
jgi:hypothetical protein